MNDKRPTIVIDATDSILGRLAGRVAKEALLGKNVEVINCKNILITGRRQNILGEYRIARKRSGSSLNGPHFPKSPERIMKRTIRGMLHYNHGRGKEAFKRIKCYDSHPESIKAHKVISFKNETHAKTIKLEEVSKLI